MLRYGAVLLAGALTAGALAAAPPSDAALQQEMEISLALSAGARARSVAAYEAALKKGGPLVVAVGCDRPDLHSPAWSYVRREPGFAGLEHGVIVARDGHEVKRLVCGSPIEDVKKAFKESEPVPQSNIRWAPAPAFQTAYPAGYCLPGASH